MGVGLVGGQGVCERNVRVGGDVGYGGCVLRDGQNKHFHVRNS